VTDGGVVAWNVPSNSGVWSALSAFLKYFFARSILARCRLSACRAPALKVRPTRVAWSHGSFASTVGHILCSAAASACLHLSVWFYLGWLPQLRVARRSEVLHRGYATGAKVLHIRDWVIPRGRLQDRVVACVLVCISVLVVIVVSLCSRLGLFDSGFCCQFDVSENISCHECAILCKSTLFIVPGRDIPIKRQNTARCFRRRGPA
jgi:hypothetical protein